MRFSCITPHSSQSVCQKVQKPHLYWFYSGLGKWPLSLTNQFCESLSAAKKVILSWRILMRFSNSVIEAFSFDKNFCYSYSRSRNHHHHDHLSISHGVHYAHRKSFLNREKSLFSAEKNFMCVGQKYNSDSQESSDGNVSNDTNVYFVYFCNVGDAHKSLEKYFVNWQ